MALSMRRMSAGAGLKDVLEEEDEGINLSPFGVIGSSRRSSAFAQKGSVDYAKQERLAESYRAIIKMSSENKITAKNSWNLDLIDNMGEMIRSDVSHRGVNFQKASCTLDASVKIYSYRVDDTITSSMRIMENLSRNAADYDDEEDDAEMEGGGAAKKTLKAGSKAHSRKFDVHRTLEKNVANINAKEIESQYAVDPTFHKMSKAFDEGGARGMLMANTKVAPSSSCIVFNASGLSPPSSESLPSPSAVDMSYLLSNAGFSLADLAATHVCPLIDEYRATLGVATSTVAVVQHSADSLSSTTYAAPALSLGTPSSAPTVYAMYEGEEEYDDADDMPDDFPPADASEDAIADYVPRSSIAQSVRRASAVAPHKFEWAAVFGEDNASVSGARTSSEKSGSEDAMLEAHGAASFQFFDMSAAQRGNDWAGARHWRRALRAHPRGRAEADEDALAVVAEPRKKRQLKEKKALEFTAEWLDEALFAAPVGRANPTVMTVAAVKKNTEKGEQMAYDLPADARAEPKDLCRLFLRPRMLVMPAMLSSMLRPSEGSGTARHSSYSREDDVVWGEVQRGVRNADGAFTLHAADFQEEEARSADYVYEDDDDNCLAGVPNEDITADSPPTGLAIRLSDMAKATRKVQKIDIGYATKSKRVNVGKLKKDLWTQLDTKVPVLAADATEAADDAELSRCVSFRGVVEDIDREQQSSEVTVSFYFICLLHLANEKNLTIRDCESMTDLFIAKDGSA